MLKTQEILDQGYGTTRTQIFFNTLNESREELIIEDEEVLT